VIPDEAVEVAAKAAFGSAWRGCHWGGRDGTTEQTRERFRREARAALEAAAPHLMAATLKSAAEDFERRVKNTRNNVTLESGSDFYRDMMKHAEGMEIAAKALRGRAAELEGKV
jgi:hypothetical protein